MAYNDPETISIPDIVHDAKTFGVGEMIMFTSDRLDSDQLDLVIEEIENSIRDEGRDVMTYDTRDKMIYYKARPGGLGALQDANFQYIKEKRAAGSFVMLLVGLTETRTLFDLATYLQAFSRAVFLQSYRPYIDKLYHYQETFFYQIWPKE